MNNTKLTVLALLLTPFFWGCDKSKERVVELEKVIIEKDESLTRVTSKNDSLISTIHDLEGKVETYQSDLEAAKAVSPTEKPIRDLVESVHKGWEELVSTGNKEALLQYFLKQYTTNAINIDVSDKPHVKRYSEKSFEEGLDDIVDRENAKITFGEPQYLYTEVKGNIFATCYRTLMRVYINNKLEYTASVVTLMAGQKDDVWRVGNYSWVTFDYN